MSDTHLSLSPKTATRQNGEFKDAWWYEDTHGIRVYVQTNEYATPFRFSIPWGHLRGALQRKDKEDA